MYYTMQIKNNIELWYKMWTRLVGLANIGEIKHFGDGRRTFFIDIVMCIYSF